MISARAQMVGSTVLSNINGGGSAGGGKVILIPAKVNSFEQIQILSRQNVSQKCRENALV